jgi:hypothetical protein
LGAHTVEPHSPSAQALALLSHWSSTPMATHSDDSADAAADADPGAAW